MRKIKARVIKDGDEYVAYSPGAYEETFEGKTSQDGYILVPLKKATSRAKGNNLELEVAKVFSQWLYGDPKVLTRTPLSGGWNGSKMGDISADPVRLMELKLQLPKLYVECKNREGLLSEEFFNWVSTGSPKRMTEWIIDTIKKAGMMPWFIILKGRGTDPWVFTNAKCDTSSFPLVLTLDGGGMYYMYPLKQLAAFNTYNNLKQLITIG